MIQKIDNVEDYVGWLDTGKEGISHEKIIFYIKHGIYNAALIGDEGIIIYCPNGSFVHVVWIYIKPGYASEYKTEIINFFKREGFLKIRANSKRNEKAFIRMSGMKKIYSTYEIKIGG